MGIKTKLFILLYTSALVYGANPNWKAQWIWLPPDQKADMMLARKTFTLTNNPVKTTLSITASSVYELYVNGHYVGRGPARSAPHHQSFDVLDIAEFLQPGLNSLAVRVHYQRGTVSHYDPARAGLLAQLEGLDIPIKTDASWRVTSDLSWHNAPPPMARFHLEVCDRVDLRRQIKGWTTPSFRDQAWGKASVLKRHIGWPSPQKNDQPTHLIPPWTTIVQRDIPYLTERVVSADEPVHVTSLPKIQNGNDWLNLPVVKRIQVSNNAISEDKRVYVYDLEDVKYGRPYLKIKAPAGTVVDIMCSPYLLDGDLRCPIVDSTYVDRIVLSGQDDHWEAFYPKPTRWLALVFRKLSGKINILDVGIIQSEYPFEARGHLHIPEAPGLQALWEASRKTIQVCTSDAYTDNYRERRQYAQTAYYACLGNYAIFGDTALQRRYLLLVAQEQLANGIMPAYAPRHGNDFMVILDSNCFWIRGLYQYLLYSGDKETTRQLLPTARKLLALLHSYTNKLGMIDSPPYPYWLDHAVNDRRGANLCLNGHYLGALEDFAQVLTWLSETDAPVFRTRAKQLRNSLHKHLWDPQQKLFADAWIAGQRSNLFSEHANAMALAMNIASPEQAQIIAQHLLVDDTHNFIHRESGITMVTPAMSYYLHAGLARHGYVKESFDMLAARFQHMLKDDSNGTLWEEWWRDGTGRTGKLNKAKTRSDAQTESAFPPALFTEFILGIRPTQPGLEEVVVSRIDSGLTKIEGSIPCPQGRLVVQWKINKDGGNLKINIPSDMQVKIDLTSLNLGPGDKVTLNGQICSKTAIQENYIILAEGEHQIQF